MKVIYDLDYGHEEDSYGNRINLVSKIVKYNPVTGEFLHYYYVNRLKEYSDGPMELRYESDPVSYTHLTLPTIAAECRSRWSPYH